MKAIKIDEERYNQLLPSNIKETSKELLSDVAKWTLAVLLNYQLTSTKAREGKFVAINNTTLCKAVGKRETDVLKAVQELIELELIKRVVGTTREKGKEAKASEYYIQWENLNKKIEKKPTYDDLFAEFFESSGSGLGTANANANANANTNANTYTNTNSKTNTNTNTNTYTNSNTNTNTKSKTHTNTTTKVTVSETIDNYTKIWKKIEKDLRFSGSELDEVRNEILETLDTKYGKILTHQELEKLKGEIWYFSLLQVEESEEDLATVVSVF